MTSKKDISLNKNIILVVGKLAAKGLQSIRTYEKKNRQKFRVAYIIDSHDRTNSLIEDNLIDILITTDLTSHDKIDEALKPYKDQLIAVTCTSEARMPQFKKIIPHVPYLRTPTEKSLDWATNKLWMRKKLYNYDKNITTKYAVVHDATKKTIKNIEEKVGFPLVVKPTGLAASVLVSVCFHEDELAKALRATFRKIKKVYKERGRTSEPSIIVEEFMEGDNYSVDCYVTSRGKVYFCPFVHIKTGQSIGFDDFFGYRQMTPTRLEKDDREKGQEVAKKAIHALGLRNCTGHVELMRTTTGWKVIEVGPRIGGFRDNMYRLSYGIEHTMNDILNRIPQKPIIPTKIIGYSAALKFFAPKEGRLTKLHGTKKIQDLKSIKSIRILKKIGDRCRYAKHGGTAVIAIILFNEDRSKLLADIRRVEQALKIETK